MANPFDTSPFYILKQKLPGRIHRLGSFCLRHLGEARVGDKLTGLGHWRSVLPTANDPKTSVSTALGAGISEWGLQGFQTLVKP
jgi:hypothetical protein